LQVRHACNIFDWLPSCGGSLKSSSDLATGGAVMLETTTILDAAITFAKQPFVTPLIISSGAIHSITEATATVTVEVAGQRATGRGSIYLSDLWAWPDPARTHDERDAVLRDLCRTYAAELPALCGGKPAHPLELGLRLHDAVCHAETPPVLARAMAASPFDAAIHDAAGRAVGRSAFAFYDAAVPLPSADAHFDTPAWQAIRQVIEPPKRRLRAWYLVGKNDGPEQLRPWVQGRGYRCLKIKLLAHDPAADAARTAEVYRMAIALAAEGVRLSVDSNEANPDAASVLAYLEELERRDPAAYAALDYLEQPTGRDITVHAFDWHAVAARRPVMLDEGLTSLGLMQVARDQGWSGFALKTCKGHSFALVAAAWARRNAMTISLQDLTNPGLAMIHAAWFAAHVPMINDVELNSPQFTPQANAPWLERLPGLFDPRDGVHLLPEKVPAGLGAV
jgi:L-alanine-DL-glutamate epimerase-like enolase superfamily enzyme